VCDNGCVKTYIHARLGKEERAALEELKETTGRTESEIVRRGLQLVVQEERRKRSALELAGRSVGRFRKGPADLSTNRRHLEGFGK
jgi:predicted DNA-binding protein